MTRIEEHITVAKNLDLVDCVLIAQAQHSTAQIFSFDKALNKEAMKGTS